MKKVLRGISAFIYIGTYLNLVYRGPYGSSPSLDWNLFFLFLVFLCFTPAKWMRNVYIGIPCIIFSLILPVWYLPLMVIDLIKGMVINGLGGGLSGIFIGLAVILFFIVGLVGLPIALISDFKTQRKRSGETQRGHSF